MPFFSPPCGITKWEGYLNTQTDVLQSDTVTVADMRFFTGGADGTNAVYETHHSFLNLMSFDFIY